MTIKEFSCNMEINYHTDRLENLRQIGAPEIVIQAEEKDIRNLESNVLSLSGDTELLNTEYSNVKTKKGKGGKYYYSFNDGTINYFPKAKYGRCIYRSQRIHTI